MLSRKRRRRRLWQRKVSSTLVEEIIHIYIYPVRACSVLYNTLYIYVCIRERGKKKEACMRVFVHVCVCVCVYASTV